MLKTVVEQVHLRPELVLGQQSRLVTILADDDWNTEPASQQQRLVTEIRGGASGINEGYATRLTSIAARQDVEFYAAHLQQFSEKQYKRRFAGAAHRQIADADNRTCQFSWFERAPFIEPISQANACAVDGGQGIHDVARAPLPGAPRFEVVAGAGRSSPSRASAVLLVAPTCECNVSVARWPSAARVAGLEISSKKTAEISASPATRTASRLWKSPTMSRKFSVCGPTTIGTPYCAGSIMLCPPRGSRLPPTNAMSANE